MLKLSCLCGHVHIEIPKRPDFANECNCTLCSKSGARWAYFHPSDVSVVGPTKGYRRDDKDDPAAEVHFCENCGSTTHFILTPSAVARFGNSQMGVNLRLADEKDLAGIELRYPDGRAWPGKGAYGYVREARIMGE
ncbi:MAG: aldehyde-activating protein [Beijerinckiaceae bacterium]|nr:aldehyde-activating protein [Beijerinckiaceae bacterium]